MNYLIAVLPNRERAEAAYSALENEGLADNQINILGEGYQAADEFGLIDPEVEVSKETKRELYWLVPFGFIAGYAFNWLTGIQIFHTLPPSGNHIIGGILGAFAGSLGAYLNGGAVGLTILQGRGYANGSGNALPYRNRLEAGKYLIIVKGTDELTRQANRILRRFDPENIQGYSGPIPPSGRYANEA